MTSATPDTNTSRIGEFRLGHIFEAAGLDRSKLLVIRHTFRPDAIRSAADVTPESVFDFPRKQSVSTQIFPK